MFDGLSSGGRRSAPGEPVIDGVLRPFLVPFALLAGAGFVASVVVHVLSWTPLVLPEWVMGLHFGIFVVWLPAVLAARPLTADRPQRDFWRAALRGSPAWMRQLVRLTLAYAVLNFIVFLATSFGREGAPTRGFSGHWMAFYGAAAAILWSALHAVDERRLCLNGHVTSSTARFCEICGAGVAPTTGARAP